MEEDDTLKTFNNKKIRTKWDKEIGDYYYSVLDLIEVLTESENPANYWKVLKHRLVEEGNDMDTICSQLKLPSHKDGKLYKTDVATTKQLLRIIQSVPSPKVEVVKQWLAEVATERLDEIANPEIAMNKSIETYRKKGYSEDWIEQRILSIRVHNDLTAEWNRSGVESIVEHTLLTDEITKAWSGKTTQEYKDYKNLQKESLTDNMTNMELILNMLGEVATTEISKAANPQGFEESKKVAQDGGTIAGSARRQLEEITGKKVVSKLNNKTNPKQLQA